MEFLIKEGNYAGMGTNIQENGVTFTFEGEKEDTCFILLVDKSTGAEERILVPEEFCMGSLRSVLVEQLDTRKFDYLYEINGKRRLDPFARVICGREVWNDRSRKARDYQVYGAFSREIDGWDVDHKPEVPRSSMFMYKLHVRGFSMDQGAPKKIAGTFAAVAAKLDYLQSLGVTTVELMPVYEFEELVLREKDPLPDYITWEPEQEDLIRQEPVEEEPGLNYWGYGPGNYFAIKASYATRPERAREEFRELVAAMHERGMECVPEIYFPGDTNHNLILEVLRYWVRVFHVDGFHLLGENLPITAVVQDVLLSRTKIFYTEFDPSLPREDKKYKNLFVYREEYLYPARKILNHINGDMREFTNQQRKQGNVLGYVNFISSNNGFTLADLFMYNDRHNEDNGENNTDGNAWNFSSNYGVEGPTRKKYVVALRRRQWRNAVLMLFMAQGVPLIWSGDEMENSQKGNNNAYCQDNPVGWLNWRNRKSHAAEIEFVRNVAQFRREHPILSQDEPFHFSDYRTLGFPDVSYHGENAWISEPDYGRMSLGMMYCGAYSGGENKEDIYVAYNFFSAVAELALPKLNRKKKWYLAIDSADMEDPVKRELLPADNQQMISMKPQSVCILVGK
jgi:glycogen operon protein